MVHSTGIEPVTKTHPLWVARFWSKVAVGSDFQCWEWQGECGDSGHGRFNKKKAHKIAFALIFGPVPAGKIVRHRCDNPPCCNPRHLQLGTQADNMADMVERGRSARGIAHAKAKLSAEQVAYIRTNPDRLKQIDLAKRFGVTESSISYIRNGKRRIYETAE